MRKSATIQTRINPEIKSKAQKVLDTLNMSMSEAISVFLTQVTLHRGIPFDIKIPNEVTAKTLKDAEDGKKLHGAENAEGLFRELEE